jgi:hypothetical protein
MCLKYGARNCWRELQLHIYVFGTSKSSHSRHSYYTNLEYTPVILCISQGSNAALLASPQGSIREDRITGRDELLKVRI